MLTSPLSGLTDEQQSPLPLKSPRAESVMLMMGNKIMAKRNTPIPRFASYKFYCQPAIQSVCGWYEPIKFKTQRHCQRIIIVVPVLARQSQSTNFSFSCTNKTCIPPHYHYYILILPAYLPQASKQYQQGNSIPLRSSLIWLLTTSSSMCQNNTHRRKKLTNNFSSWWMNKLNKHPLKPYSTTTFSTSLFPTDRQLSSFAAAVPFLSQAISLTSPLSHHNNSSNNSQSAELQQ